MSLGAPEIIIIFVLVLVLFGGKKLPEFARGLGKGLKEFKNATKEIKDEIDSSTENNTHSKDDKV